MTRGNIFLVATVSCLGASLALSSTACSPKNDTYGCPAVDPVGGNVDNTTWIIDSYCPAKYDPITSNDWCSQLIWDANGVRQVWLGHPWLPLQDKGPDGSQTHLSLVNQQQADPDLPTHTYDEDLELGPSHTTTDFPKECLTAYGQSADDCSVFADALGTYISDPGNALQSFTLTPAFYEPNYFGHVPTPSYQNLNCSRDANGGCSCDYDVYLQVKDVGTWTSNDGELSLYSATEAPPYDHDYAATGGALMMSGHEGLDVLGQHGLRTINWKK